MDGLTSSHRISEDTALCEFCLSLIPAEVIREGEHVTLLKACSKHGEQRTLLATDPSYYLKCEAVAKGSSLPLSQAADGQRSVAAVIEVLDECNLRCPTCIAASEPGAGNLRSLEAIRGMYAASRDVLGASGTVMISGGEPTIHPEILDILRAADEHDIEHLILITNGVRIAEDRGFVEELRRLPRPPEVYLQFDSLNARVLQELRGDDFVPIRRRALANLAAAELHSTLVCVVKQGLNDLEIGETVQYAMSQPFVRGVTFQPIKETGRHADFDKGRHAITLTGVRRHVIDAGLGFTEESMVPHPCNPQRISIGYVAKSDGVWSPVTDDALRLSDPVSEPGGKHTKGRLFVPPSFSSSTFRYDGLFRVTIVALLDKLDLTFSSLSRSCIHVVTESGSLVPLDSYYLFDSPEAALIDGLRETTRAPKPNPTRA